MGHSEMLLAVAGVKNEELPSLTKRLGSGDWSSFTPAESLAFQLGYKLAREPATITNADRKVLVARFGPERAIDLIWHGGWCNYMTRVADAFQLPLERDNVFSGPKQPSPKESAK